MLRSGYFRLQVARSSRRSASRRCVALLEQEPARREVAASSASEPTAQAPAEARPGAERGVASSNARSVRALVIAAQSGTLGDVARLINAADTVYVPAALDGGGDFAVLAALACQATVEVEPDNPRLMGMLWIDRSHILDVFALPAFAGRIERGVHPVGSSVEIIGLVDQGQRSRQVVVTWIQMFHHYQPEARAGENCGLLLRGVARDEVVRGQVLVAPGSVTPRTRATAELFVLAKDEGGRHTPIFRGYKPQFFFGTTDVTGTVSDLGEREMLAPGDHAEVGLELQKPVGMEPGMRFAVREGSKTVGAGIILNVS